jgi:putative oxidoreductase
MRSIGVLIVRLVVGGLLAGHGAQKLFGWFGGPGIEGTAGWLEGLRLRPATTWARIAGGSEFGGGLLTALGFLNPLGPIAAMGAMGMAWAKVHLGKPVWTTTGGAELPLTNIATLTALSLAGPGKLSLDSLLGVRVPRVVGLAALLSMLGAIWYGARTELVAGTSDVAAAGGEVEGDPSPDAAERAQVAGANGRLGIDSQDVASYEDSSLTGALGADAGTAMGSGSELGSETPVDSF